MEKWAGGAVTQNPITPLQLLKRARRLLSKKERWTQNHYARNAKGASRSPRGNSATCFCTIGALAHELGVPGDRVSSHPAGRVALDVLQQEMPVTYMSERHTNTEHIIIFNDTSSRKHIDVLRLYDRAIKKLEKATKRAKKRA